MTKQETIEYLRHEGEWWFSPLGEVETQIDKTHINCIYEKYGIGELSGESDVFGWFSLFIAEVLETEDFEYVDPIRDTAPSIMLINAMATVAPENLQAMFNPEYTNGKCTVKVELKVNGVSVPFMEYVGNCL